MTFYNHIVYLSKDLYIFSLSMMNCAIPLSSSGISSEAKLELDYQGYERIATAAVISLVLLCPLETIVLKAEVYVFVKHLPKSKISVLSMDIQELISLQWKGFERPGQHIQVTYSCLVIPTSVVE